MFATPDLPGFLQVKWERGGRRGDESSSGSQSCLQLAVDWGWKERRDVVALIPTTFSVPLGKIPGPLK